MFRGQSHPFFQGARFKTIWDSETYFKKYKYPKVIILEEALSQAFMLAKRGYFGGDPVKILEADADIIQAALDFEKFESERELAFRELNKGDKNESS